MNAINPNIHMFRTRKNYYVYDTNRNKIMSINKSIYKDFKKIKKGKIVENNWIEQMIEKGYFSSERYKTVEHPKTKNLNYYLDNLINSVTLQVTQDCNFRCRYCVFSDGSSNRDHSKKKMSFDVAKKSIKFLINHSIDNSFVSLGFYGGEPLIEMNIIKKCVQYCKIHGEGKNIIYNMTTNGSLLNKENAKFLVENNFRLTVSLDGNKNINDKNRVFKGGKGTFDIVRNNLLSIKNYYPDFFEKNINLSIVIDPRNEFDEIKELFYNGDFLKECRTKITFVDDEYLDNRIEAKDNFEEDYEYEKFKALLYFLGRIEKNELPKLVLKEIDDINSGISQLKYEIDKIYEKTHHSGPCVPGTTRMLINTDGDFYPCERVKENCEKVKIGDIYSGFNYKRVEELLNIGKLTENECKNCFAHSLCDICLVAVIDGKKDDITRNKKIEKCLSTKRKSEEVFKDICVISEVSENQLYII
ncbi:MAG: Cys-rich peptide radical SAM maturase CcpM [Clostridiales bacterium]